MRALLAPPASVVDPITRAPRHGSFAGPLPRVDLGPLGKGRIYRLSHHKKWVYLALSTPETFVGLAVVDLGYVVSTFAFAYDGKSRRMLADQSAIGHPRSGSVNDWIGEGFEAKFKLGKVSVEIARPVGVGQLEVDAIFPSLEIHARVDAKSKHSPLSAIGPIPEGVINTTEKHALLDVSGEVVVHGASRSLDNGFAGWDYTHGYLARHTQWRWGYALGHAVSGERIGFNLVEGFLGELECAVWVDDDLFPLSEGRFVLEVERPLAPWHVRTVGGEIDLRFDPGGLHAEEKNFGIVRSRFLQPVGAYSGTIQIDGRMIELDRVLGVAEDQDVLW